MYDEQVLERIMTCIQHETIQRRLFDEDDLTLAKARKLIQSREITAGNLRDMGGRPGYGEIHETYSGQRGRAGGNRGRGGGGAPKSNGNFRAAQTPGGSSSRCANCDRSHELGACPAKNADCNWCTKTGHFMACCQKKIRGDSRTPRKSNTATTSGSDLQGEAAVDAVDGHL
jgi:hypothetical protein